MLRKLTVENFYSISEAQSLDLSIARNVPDSSGRFATPVASSSERFPRVVALLGANASGKTNVLRAITFLVSFIRDSADWKPGSLIPFLPFQSRNWESRPTKFTVEFDAGVLEDKPSRIVYVYELEIAPNAKKILNEKLKYYPEGRPRRLFERSGANIEAGKDFDLPKRDPVREKIRDNASVISVLAKFNHSFALALYNGVTAVFSNVSLVGEKFETKEDVATRWYAQYPAALEVLNSTIRRFDLGIKEVVLEARVEGMKPYFVHSGLDRRLAYTFESQGTTRFYNIFPYIYFVLVNGGLAVIDEFDNDIHALLIPELLTMFQSVETNPRDGQIIMSCHMPTILEYLEKEEIYFTEKDDVGQTQVYGLKDVQGVRRETNLYAKYLAGAFGAIPRVG